MLILREFNIQKKIAALNIFVFGAAQTLFIPLIPVLTQRTGLELSSLLFCVSIGTLSFIPGTLFWARMGDVGKSDKALVINISALLISLLLLTSHFLFSIPPMTSLMIFLSGRLIWGLGVSGIPVLTQHIQIRENKTMKGYLENSFALNAGRFSGLAVALLPIATLNILLGLIVVVSALVILNIRFNKPVETASGKTNSRIVFPVVTLVILITTITGFLHSGLSAFTLINLNLPTTESSRLISKLLLSSSLIMMAGLHLGKKFRETEWKTIFAIGAIFLATGLIAFTFIRTELSLFFNIAAISFGFAMIHPAPIMLMKALSGAESFSSSALGSLSVLNTLGSGFGGMILAMKTDSFGALAYMLAFVLIASTIKILFFDLRRELAWKI